MSSTLRIALIASNRFPLRQPFAGGLEAHVWHLARELVDRGHEVALFAGSGSDLSLGCAEITVRELTLSPAAQGDPSVSPMEFMADHHAYLNLMMQLSDPRSGFDVVHNHSLHHLPVAMAPMMATPMITTLHTPPTPWLESALDVTGSAGTRFAAVSRHTADAWRHLAADVTVVPNGVDFRQWPLGPGGDNLVWFGRIVAEKAPHLAIAAARRADLPLVLAGPVSDTAYFENVIAPSLGEDIRYVGHLNHDELAQLVGRSAGALVTPTWDEPYGLVVAEAMSCGTPVVAFARGGIPEIVSPQSGRLVAPNDVEVMAAEIPAALSLNRIRVHRHAVASCSAEAMVSAYLELYRTTIDDRNDTTHDRLLHPPSRLRTPQPGYQHLPSTSPSGDCVDIAGHPKTASVRQRRRSSA
jgi:glycosyltransferase involved in cell wall biosynthesis